MKWLVGIFVGLAVLGLIGAVTFGVQLNKKAGDAFSTSQRQLADDWARWAPDIVADDARWKDDPLLQPRDGGDAAPLLFAHVRWEAAADAGVRTSELPDALIASLKQWGPDWPKYAGDAGVEQLDLQWMAQLSAYGYWDLEPVGGPLDAVPFAPLTEPIPYFIDVQNFAKVRLLQGLGSGDARVAAAEVRELARLSLTAEHLVAEMIGVALLGMERKAYDESVARGLPVDGWVPVAEADQRRLKRVLWAALAPFTLAATGPVTQGEVSSGRCSALKEGLTMAHFLRGYLEERLPERYASLSKALDESPCRLRRHRAVWTKKATEGQLATSVGELCGNPTTRDDALCSAPADVIQLPFVRAYIGLNLASLSTTDWFEFYRPE